MPSNESILKSDRRKDSKSDKHRRSPDSYRRRRSRSRTRSPSRDRQRYREDDRDRRRKERRRSRSRTRSRSRDRYRRGRNSPIRRRSRSRTKSPKRRESSPELTAEERDERTVFAWQLSNRIRERDLEQFFTQAGKVRCAKIIYDNKTGRAKGIAYIEFRQKESVASALALNGQKLLGVPIQIQSTFAERMRIGNLPMPTPQRNKSLNLYVGSLHYNITEDMLRGIFEPFGKIECVKIIRDPVSMRSQGYGFVHFASEEEGLKALEQLNGFEIAGRPIKVNYVVEGQQSSSKSLDDLDEDLTERPGKLNANSRLQLMSKLAEGKDMPVPVAPKSDPQVALGTQCFVLSNLFDLSSSTPEQLEEIREDVLEECSRLGGVLHMYLDKNSPQGNIYIKSASIAIANQCVQLLHGRYFSGRLVKASYIPAQNYYELFPDAQRANCLLRPITI